MNKKLNTVIKIVAGLTVIVILVGAVIYFNVWDYNHTVPANPSHNSTEDVNANSLVGIWQNSSVMAAGWADRYHFFKSGKYSFYANEMCCSCREIGNSGYFEIKDKKIILKVISEKTREGGTLVKSEGSCGTPTELVNAKDKNAILKEPKIIEKSIKKCTKPEVDYYKCLTLGENDFYKFSDNPASYSQENEFEEPKF